MPGVPSDRCYLVSGGGRGYWPFGDPNDANFVQTASLPSAVIQHAVWLYFRFTLSLRDVEEMLARRCVDASYETVRAWTLKFGPKIAASPRRRKLPPSPRWRLAEIVSSIGGEHVWIWRAVDDEGEVMDMIVQKRHDARAALRFLRRLLKNQNVEPATIVTGGLRSYRAENSHLGIRRRDRKMQGFKSRASAQGFLEMHAAVYGALNSQRHLLSRGAMCVLRARAQSNWSRAVA